MASGGAGIRHHGLIRLESARVAVVCFVNIDQLDGGKITI